MAIKRIADDHEIDGSLHTKVLRTNEYVATGKMEESSHVADDTISPDSAEMRVLNEASDHVKALGLAMGTLSKRLQEERMAHSDTKGIFGRAVVENQSLLAEISKLKRAAEESTEDLEDDLFDERTKVAKLQEKLNELEKSDKNLWQHQKFDETITQMSRDSAANIRKTQDQPRAYN